MAIHISMALSLVGTLALAGLLLRFAGQVAGARLLVGYLFGMAVWIVGNELPTWTGPDAERPALTLLATASTMAAIFFHFSVVFTGTRMPRGMLVAAYGLALTALVVCSVFSPGGFGPFEGVSLMATPNGVGWLNSFVWAGLAMSGQFVLFRALLRAHGLARRQILAVSASNGWGLLCMCGYAIAALRLPFYPWPLLLLPAYPVLLVYGILRYRVFVTNAWARRGLVWTMLTVMAVLVVALVPLLPLEGVAGRLVSGALIAAICLALAGPARRMAERLVYPGGVVTAGDIAGWRAALGRTDAQGDLSHAAETILSRRLGIDIGVSLAGAPATRPGLACERSDGTWRTAALGWEAAPPGQRRLAEIFGAVLAEEAARLERAGLMAERERERQTQARLAELGQLAAAVAHDVRNPLNIIGMAAAAASPDIRAEIRAQVDRISHLSADLLDYAKPWQVDALLLDAGEAVRAASRRFSSVEIGGGLDALVMVRADPRRLDQALENLLDNACATGARVGVDADFSLDAVQLHVCDAGPGVPEDVREKMFQPFVSRSRGGTGLGLAIVARIMAAHGGTAALTERAGWSTCVTLSFPAPPPVRGWGRGAGACSGTTGDAERTLPQPSPRTGGGF